MNVYACPVPPFAIFFVVGSSKNLLSDDADEGLEGWSYVSVVRWNKTSPEVGFINVSFYNYNPYLFY